MIIAPTLASLSLAALVIIAAVCDVRARRIPNWLVGCGLAIALAVQCAVLGPAAGSWAWITGAAAGMGLFLGVYLLGGMGAGDVKLMGAVGAFVGPLGALDIALTSFLVGGVLALAMTLVRKESRRTLASLSTLLLSLPFGARAIPLRRESQTNGDTMRLPYAVAIAAGTLLVKWTML
ncbi:A24 family peptidase [Cupriavidus basilensis]|uniref:A24 family peptidase n=1 Tax=Cupriavidus basilensis TaxID=68895 RepID=UPI0023E8B730|nr:prepilin peptidase [Cupriavidus basilensis]MDF3883901.1 prepilin peptidase [Cupriavidus basilensis]